MSEAVLDIMPKEGHIALKRGEWPAIAGKRAGGLPTDEDMQLIAPFLLEPVAPEQLYVRRMNLCNDQWDRHFERISAGVLGRLASTLPGKSVLIGHDYKSEPIGRFFGASVQKDPETGWLWLQADWYAPRTDANEHLRKAIDTGVMSSTSIGFRWERLQCDLCGRDYLAPDGSCPHIVGKRYPAAEARAGECMKNADGTVTCTVTYRGDAEALEGSIVYLGAQYDAAIVKAASRDLAQEKSQLVAVKVASGDTDLPRAPIETPWSWDAQAANEVLGDPPDWERYRRAHFWYDPERAEIKDGYKLPFAKMIEGRLMMVWRGVVAARQRLSQADIPAEDVPRVLAKMRQAYAAFDKPFPEGKALDGVGDDLGGITEDMTVKGGGDMDEDMARDLDIAREASKMARDLDIAREASKQAQAERDEAVEKLEAALRRIELLRMPVVAEVSRLATALERRQEFSLLQRTFGAELERMPDSDLLELRDEWAEKLDSMLSGRRQSSAEAAEQPGEETQQRGYIRSVL